LAIVVSVVISSMVVALAWLAGAQSQITADRSKSDEAYFAAEAGAQRFAWYVRNVCVSTLTPTGTYTDANGTVHSVLTNWGTVTLANGKVYTYSADFTQVALAYTVAGTTFVVKSGTWDVTCTATYGNISYTLSERITPPGAGVATVASLGNYSLSNVDVTGNVAVAGTVATTSDAKIMGDLTYGVAPTIMTKYVTASTQGAFSPLDFAAITDLLWHQAADSGLTYPDSMTNPVFDFTALNGTDKVIYVNGDVINPKCIGSGTLYVDGKISVDQDIGNVDTGDRVFLVAKVASNITTGVKGIKNNHTICGGIYTNGIVDCSKFVIDGLIYAGGDVQSNSGNSSIKGGPAAWFDPRRLSGIGAGGAKMNYANFSGPQP